MSEEIMWDLVMRGAEIKVGDYYIQIDNDGLNWVLAYRGVYRHTAKTFKEMFEYLEDSNII